MISVTGYCRNNEPRVYGRHDTDVKEAERIAREYAAKFVVDYPIYGPVSEWCFKQDACDRQVFQAVRPR